MYALLLAFISSAFLFSAPAAGIAAEKMKPIESVRLTTAEVEEVAIRDGKLYGKVVNKSDHPIKDVKLLIRHVWIWNDEYDPGRDIYSTSTYLPLAGVIEPGQSKPFVYAPSLPEIPGGHFETKVIVGEFRTVPKMKS